MLRPLSRAPWQLHHLRSFAPRKPRFLTVTLELALSGFLKSFTRSPRVSGNGSLMIRRPGDGATGVSKPPYDPQTHQDWWHHDLAIKLIVLRHYLPGDLKRQIEAFMEQS